MADDDIVIRVEGVGKRYRLGAIHHDRLADALMAGLSWLRGRRDPAADGKPSHGSHPDHVWALRDVSFEVKRGDVVGLIGGNGAGKSTLLKILTGVTKPTTGRAWLKGRVGSLLEVGTGFHPELTGRENVFLNGTILGMRTAEVRAKLDEIIDFAGIEDFIDTPVKRYSSGMYMRLAFSVAAHLEPEILLIDEVLAVGDVAFQKKCLGKMEEVSSHGRTVVFVSHNVYALQSLCRSGVLLERGQVALTGKLATVLGRYLQDASNQSGEVYWPQVEQAPGDERVRLRRVRLTSEGQVVAKVGIATPFDIEVDYDCCKPANDLMVFFHLHTSMGQWLISSAGRQACQNDAQGTPIRQLPTGSYRTSCRVPGAWLNDGQYSLSVVISLRGHQDVIVNEPHLLQFAVEDDGFLRDEYDYMGAWPTLLRPRLPWATTALA